MVRCDDGQDCPKPIVTERPIDPDATEELPPDYMERVSGVLSSWPEIEELEEFVELDQSDLLL
jgi:hypothetical protein